MIDAGGLLAVSRRLGDAAIDPAVWPEIMEEISTAIGATGAILLQSDVRTPDVPRSAGVREAANCYFAEGWHLRDIRARGVPLLLQGEKVFIDQDVATADELRKSPYFNEYWHASACDSARQSGSRPVQAFGRWQYSGRLPRDALNRRIRTRSVSFRPG
jgi:hypothetical protein